MQPLSDVMARWRDFYSVLGEASATMTGLLFVAISVGSGVFTLDRVGAVRMFLSASLVGFASVLAVSLIALAPLRDWDESGGLVSLAGGIGLLYGAFAWRGAVRDGVWPRVDLEDRCWYAAAPACLYAALLAIGVAALRGWGGAPLALALATVALLIVAIHNAWDITVWSATRRRD
jgi:hypothetical protein